MNFSGALLLSSKPCLLLAFDGYLDMIAAAWPAGLKGHVFTFPMWDKTPWSRVAKLVWRSWRFPFQTTWLLPTATEVRRVRLLGGRAEQLSHNLLCSPEVFHPTGESEMRYAAVYNGAAALYKRLELARDIQSLLVISRTVPDDNQLRQWGVSHAEIKTSITREQINALLNVSSCGLALSAEEGAMLASTEYLLAGLPIVTTPSRGGRAEWYNSNNHLLVDPNPQAVAEAVRAFQKSPPNRKLIREQAMTMLLEQRNGLIALGNRVCNSNHLTYDNMFASEQCLLARQIQPDQFQAQLQKLVRNEPLDINPASIGVTRTP